jgi:hypothetical protein
LRSHVGDNRCSPSYRNRSNAISATHSVRSGSVSLVFKGRDLRAERLNRYRVRVGDIVYSRRGDVERRALIRQQEDGWLCGTGCLRVRFGEGHVDPVAEGREAEAKSPKTEQEIRLALVNRLVEATARVSAANEMFSAVMSQVPSGLPHPDGTQRIHNASRTGQRPNRNDEGAHAPE